MNKTAAIAYESFTKGDRAYKLDADKIAKIDAQYPYIREFLDKEGYLQARQIRIFISHYVTNPRTGGEEYIVNFYDRDGTNKIKTFDKPSELIFSPETAAKKYPVLSPLTKFEKVIVYITIKAQREFRFHISYKNEKTFLDEDSAILRRSYGDYLPTKEDAENAYDMLVSREEEIDSDSLLDQIEINVTDSKRNLKSNWRLITESNLQIWFPET
jgi:hypothetical protein